MSVLKIFIECSPLYFITWQGLKNAAIDYASGGICVKFACRIWDHQIIAVAIRKQQHTKS